MDELEEFNYATQLWVPEKELKLRDKPKKLSANDNVDQVYELIGGVPRHAEWANQNPDQFYTRHYARRIVSESSAVLSGEIRILPALSRSDLDDPIDSTSEDVTPTDGHPGSVPAETPLPALSCETTEICSHGGSPPSRENGSVYQRTSPPSDLLKEEKT